MTAKERPQAVSTSGSSAAGSQVRPQAGNLSGNQAGPEATKLSALSQLPKALIALAIVYALWLCFLAIVAWVNVQAGNQ